MRRVHFAGTVFTGALFEHVVEEAVFHHKYDDVFQRRDLEVYGCTFRSTRATDPRISLTQATELLHQEDQIIAADPAVAMVMGKAGRANGSCDCIH